MDEIPSIINHLSVGTKNLPATTTFYDVVLATIGASRQHEVPGVAVAYGKYFPEFWVQLPLEGTACVGNGIHVAFFCSV